MATTRELNEILGSGEIGEILMTDPAALLRMTGEATVFNDLEVSLLGQRLSVPAGTIDQDWDNGTVRFQPSGDPDSSSDRILINYQLPHNVGNAAGDALNIHLHWIQENTTEYQFTVDYRVVELGGPIPAWTRQVVPVGDQAVVVPYTGGIMSQVSPLILVDLEGLELSAVVQVRVCRTDAVVGDVEALFIDAHHPISAIGSAEEYSREPVPI